MVKLKSSLQIADDLSALGIRPGDTLFIHSSFKSLGDMQGGAGAIIDALHQAVGEQGTLLMPSFNLVPHAQRASTWNIQSTSATTGYLTEYFRQMEGTLRSDHYSHSVAARGAGAQAYIQDHLQKEGCRSPWDFEPWGRTYGSGSPFHKAYTQGGRQLMLGVDYHSYTFIHFIEVLYWNRRLMTDSEAKYFWLNRDALGAYWDEQGRVQSGCVGQADCKLFDLRDFVDTLLDAVIRDPLPWRKVD